MIRNIGGIWYLHTGVWGGRILFGVVSQACAYFVRSGGNDAICWRDYECIGGGRIG